MALSVSALPDLNDLDFQIGLNFSERVFQTFEHAWTDEGMNRPGYSAEEEHAIGLMKSEAERLGMETVRDLAGNYFFVLPGIDRTAPVTMMGSHLDSVLRGGRYDGPSGVVSAMAVADMLHTHKVTPPQDLVVYVWRSEESPWFKNFATGSKLATGALSAQFLEKARRYDSDRPLLDYMRERGLDVDALVEAAREGKALIPLGRIGRLIESHIEQGSQLVKAGKNIGLVNAIRGHVRFPEKITFHGQVGHTGAVPQEERKDAVLAGSWFVVEAIAGLNSLRAQGHDLVYAFPQAGTGDSASSTTIPGYYEVMPEVRSTDPAALEKAKEIFVRAARTVSKNTGCTVNVGKDKIVTGQPDVMDKEILVEMAELSQFVGIDCQIMPSGAGHDVGVLQRAGVPCSAIFTAHRGESHDPNEILTSLEGQNPFEIGSAYADSIRLQTVMALVPNDNAGSSNRTFVEHLIHDHGGLRL